MRESEFLSWVARQPLGDSPHVQVGPGDDCAVLTVGGEQLVVTTDQVLDGVHIVVAEAGYAAAGRKAMARNLSDIAAMGARPIGATATVSLPRGTEQDDVEAIYRGLREIGDAMGCPLVGGDVAGWDQPLVVSVTVFALAAAGGPVLRSTGQPGDVLAVTGTLGGAWKGQRHLHFTPRIAEARALAECCRPTAMMDLSDGLATDLGRLCEASGVGARVNAEAIPIAPDVQADDPLTAALTDGEDYELLIALPPGRIDALLADPPFETPLTRIGELTAARERLLIHPDGSCQPLEPTGWEHTT
ncbi:MAG: thiamine-phosphate kinase [Planctomycetota bacterium]